MVMDKRTLIDPELLQLMVNASNDDKDRTWFLSVRDGKVKIKTDRDSFEARVSPDALRQIKKGDNVVIDLTISPPGSAFPRR